VPFAHGVCRHGQAHARRLVRVAQVGLRFLLLLLVAAASASIHAWSGATSDDK